MLGPIERDENGLAKCPHCGGGMPLACFGNAAICEPCDYVELASDSMSPFERRVYMVFIEQFQHHSQSKNGVNRCFCDDCIEKYGDFTHRVLGGD